MKPEDYLRLVQAGLDAQQIALVMEMLGAQERAYAEKDEERRDKARTRVQKWREKQVKTQRNVTEHNVTQRNGLREGVTRVEDNLQGKDISGKEEKKEASPSARPSRGSRIPDDFQPDIEAAVAEGVPRLEAERQARSFCDYWRSKPGKDGLKLDWPATWRVWYRRSIPTHSPPRHAAAPPNGMERMNRLLDEMQGKASEQPSTIETSFERTDSGSTASLIQFDAFAARR